MSKLYLSFSRYLTVILFLVTSVVWGQSKTVTGKVTSADDGSGLPGVNVIEKGTNNGTATDVDGNFSISVGSNATLVFTFVGYTSQEVAVGNQTSVNVALAPDVTSLSEVVVVGYGTQEKKEITSSVASVKAGDFNKGNVNDPSQLLAGKVAGLQVVREGSNPNQAFNIRLRGLSTVGANSAPLIVIDGVIGASLNSVDPNDIASMDVLKDGSAAAIYGTRGSAGVILITTKKGEAGKTTVDYNSYVSSESVARRIPVLTASEFRDFSNKLGVTGGDRGASTDWLKEITRNAISQVHTLSLGGGTKGTTYRASVNFRDIDGILKGTGFNNLNTRLNLSQKALNDKLTITGQLVTSQRKANIGFNDAFRYSTIYNPTAPIKSTDPSMAQYGGYYQETRFDFLNPVAIIEQNKNDGQYTRFNTSIGASYDFGGGLIGSVNYATQTEDELLGQYFSKYSLFVGYGRKGLATRQTNKYAFDLFEGTLNYTKDIGDLNVAALGGYSFQNFKNEGFGISAGNFVSDAFTYNDLSSALDIPNGLSNSYSYKNQNTLIAFFGRLNFNFKEAYFLSASARYEGSSRFGANNKWKLFPAVSGGVTITNLVDLPAFNSLKFRAGYGVTGQQPSNSYLSLLTFGRSGNFIVNGQYVPGYAPTFNANPNLQWEEKGEVNVGFDFVALSNRLTGSIDWYNRKTSNFLQFQSVPVPPNLAPNTWLNGGDLRNTGLEVALNYALVQKSDLNVTTGINLATFKTEIIDLNLGASGERFQAGVGSPGQNSSFMIRVKEGQPVGQIFGPKFVRIDEAGKWEFQDTNGDGKFDEKDFQVLGQGLPKATVNWNTTIAYKNWDFNFLVRSAFGHSIVNQYRVFYEAPGAITSYNVVESARDIANLTDAPRYSSLHVEKGNYVNMDNMTLGYTFPLGKSSVINRFRMYLTGQNVFLITKYKGADPEVRYVDTEDNNNPLSAGIDRRNTWVRTRTITLGLNLTF